MFLKLLAFLEFQVDNCDLSGLDVEIIYDEDSKQKSIGKKRQDLLDRARGLYVVGIDSDDWVSDDYVSSILSGLEGHPDNVGFYERVQFDDGPFFRSRFSILSPTWCEVSGKAWNFERCANPKSVVRRDLALKAGYPDIRFGEDQVFAEVVTSLCETEYFIERELYYYHRVDNMSHNERYGIS